MVDTEQRSKEMNLAERLLRKFAKEDGYKFDRDVAFEYLITGDVVSADILSEHRWHDNWLVVSVVKNHYFSWIDQRSHSETFERKFRLEDVRLVRPVTAIKEVTEYVEVDE